MRDDKGLGVPAGAGPRLSNAQVLLALADRCERDESSRELDGRLLCAIYSHEFKMWDGAGAVIGRPGGISGIGHIPSRDIRPFTSDLTAARSLSNWLLAFASDIGSDALPLVVLGNPGTGHVVEGRGGRTLELTWCAAALRACAADAGL